MPDRAESVCNDNAGTFQLGQTFRDDMLTFVEVLGRCVEYRDPLEYSMSRWEARKPQNLPV